MQKYYSIIPYICLYCTKRELKNKKKILIFWLASQSTTKRNMNKGGRSYDFV